MKHSIIKDQCYRDTHSFSGPKDEAKRLIGILLDKGIGFRVEIPITDYVVISEIPSWGFDELMRDRIKHSIPKDFLKSF